MPDTPADFLLTRLPKPNRPLAGLTVLVVEDSRFACEALRLMCQHSGARLRRADCLAAARRHLRVYRPDVLIVDLGLPDGPGEELIADLAARPQRPAVMLATSGDPTLAAAALAAGADGFLDKPLDSLGRFQRAVLDRLNGPTQTPAPRASGLDAVLLPDPIALRDDLAHAEGMLADHPDAVTRAYLSRFLAGIARSARDPQLADAAAGLAGAGPGREAVVGRVTTLVRARLAAGAPLWTAPSGGGSVVPLR